MADAADNSISTS